MAAYSEEQTKYMIEEYTKSETPEERDEVIKRLSKELDKPKRSIIGKLSKEGIYIKKTYKTKQGSNPVTKKEMIMGLAILINADPELIQGLEKTPKMELEYVITKIQEKLY